MLAEDVNKTNHKPSIFSLLCNIINRLRKTFLLKLKKFLLDINNSEATG